MADGRASARCAPAARWASLASALAVVSCGPGRVGDSLLSCSDWGPPAAAPVAGASIVAENAAWVRADPGGSYLVYRSSATVRVRRMSTGEERSVALADGVQVFLGAVDGGRLVAYYSDRSQGFQEYVLVDVERCEWRVLGITVSTVDPVIGYSKVSAMSLNGERLFYAINRGALQPSQEFLLELSDSSRRAADATARLVTDAQLEGDRVVWLQQKDPGNVPGVVAWSATDGALLAVDLPATARPKELSASGSRAVWTDSRDVYTAPPDTNIYMLDLSDGSVTQLTSDQRSQEQPSILGHLVAWSDDRSGNFDICVRNLDTGEERVVAGTPEAERLPILTAAGIVWQVAGATGATVWFDPSVHP